MTKCENYSYKSWVNNAVFALGESAAVAGGVSTIQYICNSNQSLYQFVYPNTPSVTSSVYNVQYETPNWASNWYNAVLGGVQCLSGGSLIQPPETAEERAAREKRIEEKAAKKNAASLRAEHLLFSILTPSQVKQYTDDDCFDVTIEGRTYRIRKGYSRNVELIEAGKPTARYCAHPVDAPLTPVPDAMLAQLLMLRANEQGFLNLANRTVLQ